MNPLQFKYIWVTFQGKILNLREITNSVQGWKFVYDDDDFETLASFNTIAEYLYEFYHITFVCYLIYVYITDFKS